jgi:hypothetical protein
MGANVHVNIPRAQDEPFDAFDSNIKTKYYEIEKY